MKKIEIIKYLLLLVLAVAVAMALCACDGGGGGTEMPEVEPTFKFVANYDGTCYVSGIDSKDYTKVTVPEKSPEGHTVVGIGSNAFKDCGALESISLPKSISYIKSGAFEGCDKLIQVEGGISYVDKWIIGCEESVVEVTLRADTVGIAEYAFQGCAELVTITVGADVTAIGEMAFDGCNRLVEVYNLSALDITSRSRDFGGIGYFALSIHTSADEPSDRFVTDDGYIMYDGEIGAYLLGYIGEETALVLPESCNGKSYQIHRSAFSGYDTIISVEISEGATHIGNFAFEGCSELISVNIAGSVKEIGEQVFASCQKLAMLTIGQGVERIGYKAFYCCTALEELTVPDSVVEIGDSAFSFCSGLTSVVIGDGVRVIDSWAFTGCSSLRVLTLGVSVELIDYAAFSGCFRMVEVYDLSSLGITAGSDEHGYAGFYALAVYDSPDIKSKQWVHEGEYIFFENGSECFLTGYIGNQTDIVLPENCNGKKYKINKYSFDNSAELTRVTIPENVTAIGEYAFYYCISLEYVVMGKGVKRIDGYAFEDCPWFKVYYKGTSSQWSKITIRSQNSKLKDSLRFYYSESEPTASGYYWHYDERDNVVEWE